MVVSGRALASFAAGTLVLLALGSANGAPASQAATPANLAERLATARPGETLRLSAGDYGVMTFPRRVFSPAIRIDARAAQFTGLVLDRVSGVTIAGGQIVGPGGRSYGIRISFAKDVRIDGMTISGAHRGIVIDRSSDIAVVGNRLQGLISDGVNIALSRRILVERNICRDFGPALPLYGPDRKMIRDGDHPDCIQAWSRPIAPPTADVQVLNNDMEGAMQGIFFGNHVTNGVDDGGFDRIVIRGNRVRVGYAAGIVLDEGRDSDVTGNRVSSLPGFTFPSNGQPVRAQFRFSGERNRVCGNIVSDFPANPATLACP